MATARTIEAFRSVVAQTASDPSIRNLMRRAITMSMEYNLNYCDWYACVDQMRRNGLWVLLPNETKGPSETIGNFIETFSLLREHSPEFMAFRRSLLRTCIKIARSTPKPEIYVEPLLRCALLDYHLYGDNKTWLDWAVHVEELSISIIHIYGLLLDENSGFVEEPLPASDDVAKIMEQIAGGPEMHSYAPLVFYLVSPTTRVEDRETYMDKTTAFSIPMVAPARLLFDLVVHRKFKHFDRSHDGVNLPELAERTAYAAENYQLHSIVWDGLEAHNFVLDPVPGDYWGYNVIGGNSSDTESDTESEMDYSDVDYSSDESSDSGYSAV